MIFRKISFLYILIVFCCGCQAQKEAASFTNPLLPAGADPFSFYKDSFYYYTHTTGHNITIWKTKNLSDLPKAVSKVIFTPPIGTMYSKNLWAPEILYIEGKWYIYFAADDGYNKNHRMYVLENPSPDPMKGEWTFKGKIADASDKWAIDGDVFRYYKQWYIIWSGWESNTNGRQDIYIARLKDPWTIDSERVRISSPDLSWETHGYLNDTINPSHVSVNEGPQALQNGKNLFIIYSASGCWTDYYALGMLTLTGEDLLAPSSWKKSKQPVFKQSPQNGVYAPGHNSFFKSPDGSEDWILYHANAAPGQGCGSKRSPRAQKFTWNSDGSPNFGEPVKTNVYLKPPSENNYQTTIYQIR
jgi:GH43 family beta-xylosidase